MTTHDLTIAVYQKFFSDEEVQRFGAGGAQEAHVLAGHPELPEGYSPLLVTETTERDDRLGDVTVNVTAVVTGIDGVERTRATAPTLDKALSQLLSD